MAQWVKGAAAKYDKRGSVPRSDNVEEETNAYRFSAFHTRDFKGMCTHKCYFYKFHSDV